MLRHPWRAAAASATVIGSSAYLYHAYSRRPRAAHQDSFDLPVRSSLAGPDGKRAYTTQAVPLLAMSDVDMRIRAYASSRAVARPGGIVWKHASAQLASNSPIEDARADAIVERDPAPGASASDGDYLFFSVMDGHGGPHTSRLLARTLIPAVALQLHELAQMQSAYVPRLEKAGWLDGVYSLLSSTSHKPHTRHVSFAGDPTYVSLAIQTAFAMADSEIVNAPLRLIAEHLAQSKSSDPAPDLSQHPMALPSMLPALSGSCALLALLDTAHRDLYVACTGDCRAVAGVWEEAPDGTGTWRVEVLSEDQTGRNPSELKRMQSEHPQEEASTVIQRGRVLGGLEPSRAFGDARYKWPFKVQQLCVFPLLVRASLRTTID
ncbi:phosphatase 2C-like domain-containing protein [Phellopilus nigrolimitatus]|nr:phosphatase 2C-like domain-containing protein [Phellopilus nigrolimitatus]